MDEYTTDTVIEANESIPELTESAVADGTSAEEEKLAPDTQDSEDGVNYEELMRRDLEQLKGEFPELEGTESIAQIKNPLRYGALRDLGLSPTEAYLACRGKVAARDNRAHLHHSVPRFAKAPIGMSRTELERARELFGGMSDAEIQSLYRRVTG